MRGNGFTKIEFLIAVILILIVIGVDIIVVSYLNNKERDIKVLSEIDQLRSALEVNIQLNNHYPRQSETIPLNDSNLGTEKLCSEGFRRVTDSCEKNILLPIPNQYKPEGNVYTYQSIDNGQNYKIEFTLQTDFKDLGLAKGINCADQQQIYSQPCQSL